LSNAFSACRMNPADFVVPPALVFSPLG
jgi:hypothetical protein